jgi:hypothetical protein
MVPVLSECQVDEHHYAGCEMSASSSARPSRLEAMAGPIAAARRIAALRAGISLSFLPTKVTRWPRHRWFENDNRRNRVTF